MTPHVYVRRSRVEASAEDLFAWHERPGALERLTPPWEPVEIVDRVGTIRDGDRTTLRLRLGPLRLRWVAEHRDYLPGRSFRDVQISGPFRRWEHGHEVTPDGPMASHIEDRIVYELPFAPLGEVIAGGAIRRKLDRMFTYRHQITQGDLAAHAREKEDRPMNLLITGSTGLIGRSLVPFLTAGGHRVTRLARGWTEIPPGIEGVVHLAGEPITGRWNAAKKRRILESRRDGNKAPLRGVRAHGGPPRVLVSASAVGFYGDRGDEVLTEESRGGPGFLRTFVAPGRPGASPRGSEGFGSSTRGSASSSAATAALSARCSRCFGWGSAVARRRQTATQLDRDLDDADRHHSARPGHRVPGGARQRRRAAVGDEPEFTRTLARVLGRPAVFPDPGSRLETVFGEAADAMLLAGQRVEPARLQASGYVWRYPELDTALTTPARKDWIERHDRLG